MKSFFAGFLLITYLVVSSGFTVSMHYCMGKMDSVQLGVVKQDQCSGCGMHTEDGNGCCRDEIKVVKLQQDLQMAKSTVPFADFFPAVKPAFLLVVPGNTLFTQLKQPLLLKSPPAGGPPEYIKNCVFRI